MLFGIFSLYDVAFLFVHTKVRQVQNPTIQTYCFILFSVSASAVAQLLLKIGMSQNSIIAMQSRQDALSSVIAIAQNLWVLGGLGLYFLGALVWLKVLSKVELSFAYPFVGLGFILTMLLGKFFLDDNLSLQRMIGTLCIVLGVLFIAMDKNIK
jgi:drug/metabolite transporter (DMT)-like permease